MIYIKYRGRMGNRIFQYVFARILGHITGQKVYSTPRKIKLVDFKLDDNIEIDEENNNNLFDKNNTINRKEEYKFLKKIKKKKSLFKNIQLKCYAQDHRLFKDHKDFVKNILIIKNTKIPYEINNDDIVIHLRLDDFNHNGYNSEIFDVSFYEQILEKEEYKRLFIVYDNRKNTRHKEKYPKQKLFEKEQKYLQLFNKFNPIFYCNTDIEDFNFIRQFKKIIMSTSSFCFWAVYLSNVEKIYIPNSKWSCCLRKVYPLLENYEVIEAKNVNLLNI